MEKSRDFVVKYHIFTMDYLSGSWQEWLTVSAYLGLTVFVMWCVFATQRR
ncbi:hypothetical protein [Anabaena azotica]|nr:hypothetical protein [Anabaena azotica]